MIPDWAQYQDIAVSDPDEIAAVVEAAETASLDDVVPESVVSQEWADWVDAGCPGPEPDPEGFEET